MPGIHLQIVQYRYLEEAIIILNTGNLEDPSTN